MSPVDGGATLSNTGCGLAGGTWAALEPGMSTKDAHRVNSKTLLSDNSIEIYSGTFVSSLRSLAGGLDHGCSYRLTGVTVPSENMVIFPLDSLERIER